MADTVAASGAYAAPLAGRCNEITMNAAEHKTDSGKNLPMVINALLFLLFMVFYLHIKIIALRERIKKLEVENQALYEQSRLGSDTSSIPPNKDWKHNAVCVTKDGGVNSDGDLKEKNLRETPSPITHYLRNGNGVQKRPGGQKYHPPSFMKITDAQEREPVYHYPEKCLKCPDIKRCIEQGKLRKYMTSHEYDIEIIRVHKKHLLFEATNCLHDDTRVHESFPEILGTQFYGTNVQLHVLTWHHLFYGSYDRIDLAAKELLGLTLSAGTAKAILKRGSALILNCRFMDALRFYILLYEMVTGVDETSARTAGRNAWVHTLATSNVTLLTAHWKRGYQGAIYSGVLPFYTHTLISDCWSAYFNENLKCGHAVCDGHILRELVAAAYFRSQDWAINMFDLLLEVFSAKADAVERGDKSLPEDYIGDVRVRYSKIIADGLAGIPGTDKGKTFSLLKRLSSYENAVLKFAVDFNVAFTNNVSEISLRNLKVALRVASQFKTMHGLSDYCIIQSFMDTCRKQKLNPFDIFRVLMSGGDVIEAVFGIEKATVLKRMIRLADAFSNGDISETDVSALMNFGLAPDMLTAELIEAVKHKRYKPCDEPPSDNKKPVEKTDKMKDARRLKELKEYSRLRHGSKQNTKMAYAASG